jgi:hypothetical protein
VDSSPLGRTVATVCSPEHRTTAITRAHEVIQQHIMDYCRQGFENFGFVRKVSSVRLLGNSTRSPTSRSLARKPFSGRFRRRRYPVRNTPSKCGCGGGRQAHKRQKQNEGETERGPASTLHAPCFTQA